MNDNFKNLDVIQNSTKRDTNTINVKDFGAKGDGSTDDSSAIQATLNYAAQFEDAIIYFPKGNYLVTNDITIPLMRTLRFIGDGHGERTEYYAFGGSCIILQNAQLNYAGTSWTQDGLHFSAERMKFALKSGTIYLPYSYFNLYDSAVYVEGNYPVDSKVVYIGYGGPRQLPLIWKNVQITDNRQGGNRDALFYIWYEGIDLKDVDFVSNLKPESYTYTDVRVFQIVGNTYFKVDGFHVFLGLSIKNWSGAAPYESMFWVYNDVEEVILRNVQFMEAKYFKKGHIYSHHTTGDIYLTLEAPRLREEGDFMLPTWTSNGVVFHPIIKTLGEGKVSLNANTTLGIMEGFVQVDASSGPITITLPTSNDTWIGREITIAKIDNSVNGVTVAANTSQTIEGNASIALNTQYDKVKLVYNGNNIWLVM